MQRRWWVLGALLVVAIAAGFGVGSAVKSSSASPPAHAGSLASGASGTGTRVAVTRPGAVGPVPPLKPKPSRTTSSSSSSSSSTTGAVTTQTTATTVTHISTTPPPTQQTTATHTTVQSTTTGGGGGGGGVG
jgi:hypothetical protein